MLILQALMTSLIQIFKLEEEGNDIAGYILTALFSVYAMVYSGSWMYVIAANILVKNACTKVYLAELGPNIKTKMSLTIKRLMFGISDV